MPFGFLLLSTLHSAFQLFPTDEKKHNTETNTERNSRPSVVQIVCNDNIISFIIKTEKHLNRLSD